MNPEQRLSTLAIDPVPSFAEAAEIQEFWEANYARLLGLCPEQFVAVDLRTGAVIATDPNIDQLVVALRNRGLDPRLDVAIEWISASKANLLL